MADKLENLVKQAETDISNQKTKKAQGRKKSAGIPRFSIAIGIWMVAIILGALQFDEVISIVSTPAESKIERDLGSILSTAASSLHHYEAANGVLPPLLPNPAIRGLVKYDRLSDFNFQLTATISNVTMVMSASSTSPRRKTDYN